jgi:glutaredoxin
MKIKSIFYIIFMSFSGCIFSNTGSNIIENPGCKEPLIIIYGADFCHPCEEAAEYVRAHNYCLLKKDVEKDSAAKDEIKKRMNAKGMEYGSLPVIDIDGELRVGYSAEDLGATIERHKK